MKFDRIIKNNIEYYTVPKFLEYGFMNIFTTKLSGESFSTKELNFGTNCSDTEDAILKNYENTLKLLNTTTDKTVKSKQTHSDIILTVDSTYGGEGILKPQRFTEADGLITTDNSLAILVFYADCVPILLADKKKKIISAVHSGWKGTENNITGKAVKKLINEFNSDPNDIIAAIGPSIGVCHFEVGEDVYLEMTKNHGDNTGKIKDGKFYLDLKQAVYNQLTKNGVLNENIALSDKCTFCENEFYSYRREGEKAGRMSAFIKCVL